MATKDGGPAFPLQEQLQAGSDDGSWLSPGQAGMSLRDYFAGQALQAIHPHARESRSNEELATYYAGLAYLLADAMLKEREAK